MNIALVAHDNKKILMENLCIAYRHILNKHTLFATGSTGALVEETANLTVNKYLSGHLGGEQQLGSQIINNDIDLSSTYDKVCKDLIDIYDSISKDKIDNETEIINNILKFKNNNGERFYIN